MALHNKGIITVPPGLPSIAAFFIDVHVPLINASPPPRGIFDVYRRKLAPEHQGNFPVAVGPPFPPPNELVGRALAAAWTGVPDGTAPSTAGKAKTGALLKLLRKCAQPPASIRYINPQAERGVESGGHEREAIRTIITAGQLNAYVDCTVAEVASWSLDIRAKLYASAATDQGLRAIISSAVRYVTIAFDFPANTLRSSHGERVSTSNTPSHRSAPCRRSRPGRVFCMLCSALAAEAPPGSRATAFGRVHASLASVLAIAVLGL